MLKLSVKNIFIFSQVVFYIITMVLCAIFFNRYDYKVSVFIFFIAAPVVLQLLIHIIMNVVGIKFPGGRYIILSLIITVSMFLPIGLNVYFGLPKSADIIFNCDEPETLVQESSSRCLKNGKMDKTSFAKYINVSALNGFVKQDFFYLIPVVTENSNTSDTKIFIAINHSVKIKSEELSLSKAEKKSVPKFIKKLRFPLYGRILRSKETIYYQNAIKTFEKNNNLKLDGKYIIFETGKNPIISKIKLTTLLVINVIFVILIIGLIKKRL